MSVPPIPKPLVRAIEQSKAVLFVGAGLSMEAGLPGMAQLLAGLKSELDEAGQTVNTADAFEVAEYYQLRFGRVELEQRLRDSLEALHVVPTATHRALVKVPWVSIVTTNYDRLLERSLEAEGIPHSVLLHNQSVAFARADRVNLVKMHGDLFSVPSIVLTREDYEQFATRCQAIIQYIAGLIQSHVFLFIGFSLTDPNFQRIWNLVHQNQQIYGPRSFALLRSPEELQVQLWLKRNLQILPYADHGELRQFAQALLAAVSPASAVAATPTAGLADAVATPALAAVAGRAQPAAEGSIRLQLRNELMLTLRSASTFDSFVLDMFPAVKRRYSDGMDQNQKLNILFEEVMPEEIRQRLTLWISTMEMPH